MNYSVDEFKSFVSSAQAESEYKKPLGFSICRADLGQVNSDRVLQCHYPLLNWEDESLGSYAVFYEAAKLGEVLSESESEKVVGVTPEFIDKALELFNPFMSETIKYANSHKNISMVLELDRALKDGELFSDEGEPLFRFVTLFSDSKCQSVESGYMKLMALSLGKAPLRSLNLDGVFGLLTNVAWSGNYPYELDYLRENEIALKFRGQMPVIDYVDKFPRYLMHVIPQHDNIRLLDSTKTRFGAFLGAGYTQMPGASYVNFNAGALGACMNEGRISSSVIVGEGSDIGGGASIMGVLSGGNSEPISIGKNCLLGVNSSTGISLGDGCIVDGGATILAGTKLKISQEEAGKIKEINPDFEIKSEGIYKGRDLSGLNGIHFRQNSLNGEMIALRSSKEIALNTELH
ncbi:MAG: tetrahydrodipicolinate N-succinyltransferase N-terminal domain-containing protein [Campylobacterales bacterium]